MYGREEQVTLLSVEVDQPDKIGLKLSTISANHTCRVGFYQRIAVLKLSILEKFTSHTLEHMLDYVNQGYIFLKDESIKDP